MTWRFWAAVLGWTKRTTPAPKRYPRGICVACGKTVAFSSKGGRRHHCNINEETGHVVADHGSTAR